MTTQNRTETFQRGRSRRAPSTLLLLIVAVLMSPVPAAPQEADGEIEAVLRHLEGTFPSVVERGELVFTARFRARHSEQRVQDHLARLRAASQRSGIPMSESEEGDTPDCDEVDAGGRPLGSCRWSRDRIPLYISPPSVDEAESGTRYSVSFHFVSPGPDRIPRGTVLHLFGNHLVFRVVPDEDGTMRVEQLGPMHTLASTTPIPHR